MDFYRRCYGTDGYLTDFPGLTKESATWLGRPKQEGRASGMVGASSPVPLEDLRGARTVACGDCAPGGTHTSCGR
jgi:hypothetical protein